MYFVSGGSEAIEAALKMARQYFVEIGQPQRAHFIARRQSYHGNTLGALAVGGNEWRREQFAPLLIDVDARVALLRVPRPQRAGETPRAVRRAAGATSSSARSSELGPDNVIAFVAETVGRRHAGAVPPVPGYFKRVREVCDRHGVLLILDEVMCGMGRTGTLHACEQEGVVPDLMVIAKGLGGGYQPIGAVLAHAAIVDAMRAGSGFFQHGHTYLGHAVACAAALAVQQVIERDGLLDAGAARAAQCFARSAARAPSATIRTSATSAAAACSGASSWSRTARRKAPFDPALQAARADQGARRWRAACMCYPMGGTIDGVRGDHVLLAPPFIATEAQLDEIVDTPRRGASTPPSRTASLPRESALHVRGRPPNEEIRP